MNSEGYPEGGFPAMDSPAFTSEGGTFFAGSQGFTINNGVFNNVTTLTVPSDVRKIPLGDIDLQTQLRAEELYFHEESGLVRRRSCSRRVYSAKVGRRGTNMTVVVYEGDAAEQGWHRDAAKYLNIRHPNILQIYGVAASRGIHASLFHGDLIPYREFLDRHRKSFIVKSYIMLYVNMQFETFREYFESRFTPGEQLSWFEDQFWVRPLTGQLSTELRFFNLGIVAGFFGDSSRIETPTFLFDAPGLDAMVIDCMTLEDFHLACIWVSKESRQYIPPATAITLGAAVSLGRLSEHPDKDYVEVAFLREAQAKGEYGWRRWLDQGRRREDIMPDGWTRFFVTSDLTGAGIDLSFTTPAAPTLWARWLSQANYIFKTGQITSCLDNYALLDSVTFTINFEHNTHDPPEGYIFLCPETHFQTGPMSLRWPDYPAYWSLDPTGLKPLSADDAESLGFPSFLLQTTVDGSFWDASVYAALRQFHTAKGFDPDSQDLARHLGYPLYELVSRMEEPTSAHIDSLPEDSETVSVLDSKAPAEDTEAVKTAPTLISRLISGVSAILEPKEDEIFGSLV